MSEAVREAVKAAMAKALAEADGLDPDAPTKAHDWAGPLNKDEPLPPTWALYRLEASAALTAIAKAGFAVVPVTPTPGLLMSMAIRYDHGLGVPGYYDQEFFTQGITHAQRLQGALTTMRQLHEEVVGTGVYSANRDAEHAAMIAAGGVG